MYATPATVDALEDVLSEADANHDVGDPQRVLDAVEPITERTAVTGDIRIRPVPAGHAPGAAGFLLAFDDAGRTHTVLATGDFTHRRAAGFPGFPIDAPLDADVVLLTGATRDDVEERSTEAAASILERGRGGSRVLVSSGGLRSVRLAYLLGHAARSLGLSTSITLVGQAAKLYEALAYEVPGVETVPVFDDPASVLAPGEVTIAGPEVPTEGSSARLFAATEDDPSAALFQVGSGGVDPVESAGCTVETYAFSNHPTRDALDAMVEATEPIHVVVKHQRGSDLGAFREAYDDSFVWATTDADRFALYENGNWAGPPWMSDQGARHVLGRRSVVGRAVGTNALQSSDSPVERVDDVDLSAEGIDVDAIAERLHITAKQESAAHGSVADEAASRSGTDAPTDCVATDVASTPLPDETSSTASSTTDRTSDADVTLADIDGRLDNIERALGGSPVDARVVDAGEGLVLLRVVDPEVAATLSHGEHVTVRIDETDRRADDRPNDVGGNEHS